MAELISYLREYNKTASAGEDIRFYGFDMQRVSHTFRLLTEACAEYQIDMTGLGEPAEGEPLSDAQAEALKQIREKMQAGGAPEKELHCADMLLQYYELQSGLTADGGALRDRFMAENAEWILRQEQQNGRERIFVTGHNSHIAKWGSYESMGKILSEEAENGYYAIGTDFTGPAAICRPVPPQGVLIRCFIPATPWRKRQGKPGTISACLILRKSRKIPSWADKFTNIPIWVI